MKRPVMGLGIAAVALGAMVGIARSVWVVVEPDEVAIVRRWGRVLDPWPPGPHLAWPPPIDRVRRVRVDQVRQLEIGGLGIAAVGEEPGTGEFLTADRNLLRARAVVQYRVDDPRRYVLAGEIEPSLRRVALASLTAALAGQSIDATLGPGRLDAARATARRLADGADRLGLGVVVLGVSLTDARPPGEVAAEFTAAQAARSDRDRRVIEARQQAEIAQVAAGAEAQARLDAARAEADRRVPLARAQAERFLSLREEARQAPRLTVGRLYRDALRDLLPRVGRKVLLAPGEPVDLSLYGKSPDR